MFLCHQRPTQEAGDGGSDVTTGGSGAEQVQENVGLAAAVRTAVIGEDISVTARVVTSTHRDKGSFVDQQAWTDDAIRIGPVNTVSNAAWLTNLPLTDIGSAFFTTGLLAVAFKYVDRKDGDERANERLRQVLREEAPTMRKAVVDGFTFSADALKDVASPELLDRLITNALALRLDDHALVADAYTDLRDQLVQAPERWYDIKASIALSPWDGGPAAGDGSMFVATMRWEYRVQPSTPTVRFACVADLDEYRELLRDPTIVSVLYFGRPPGTDAVSAEAFALAQCAVNGVDRPIRRAQRKGSQLYTATLPATAIDQEVAISCIYRVLIQRHGRLLYLDIPRPTKGLQVQFSYGGCGIRRVNTLDFIASAQQPRILRSPAAVPTPSVEIGFDGWIFPKSGMAFVWVLEGEMRTDGTGIAHGGGTSSWNNEISHSPQPVSR